MCREQQRLMGGGSWSGSTCLKWVQTQQMWKELAVLQLTGQIKVRKDWELVRVNRHLYKGHLWESMPVPTVQMPVFFVLASVQMLLPSPLSLIPFLPGYPLLNHFTLLPSVVCILCILFFGYLSVLPLSAFISSPYLSGSIYLFLILPSFLACIIHCPFWYLLFPLLWLSSVFHLHTPSYLYVSSPYLSTV